jgi:serine/threonine protein kinase/tetratricopeptide (TPR) repeat protein
VTTPNDATRLSPDPSVDAARARRIGPYRLVQEIGHGGMGAVYLAVRDDDAFQKRVAVKVLRRGMDTDAIISRFRNERQILAGLDHPNIARLIDGGSTSDGLPYFVMEYVDGAPIDEYADRQHLDTTARLDLFQQVCAAVQYAHQNLIIHRDIKPANVLVTRDGVPKLLDFGIAKLVNPELAGHTLAPTAAGLQLMTPQYASPEQVRGDPVTTATDVYSLGMLLYELLTGRRPYEVGSCAPSDIARVVCETVPPRPSTAVTTGWAPPAGDSAATPSSSAVSGTTDSKPRTRTRTVDPDRLRRRLAGDLDNIVMKALSKEPPRRYGSVDQFAEDVRRHLAGLPVIARKDTFGYRASKFVRRNRAAVAAAVCVVLALVGGIIGVAWQASVARTERARAEQRFDDVRALATAFLFDLHDAIRDLPGSTPARQLVVTKGMEYLDKLSQDAGDRPDLRRELAAGYLRVGDVQGRPFNPNLGDTDGALESYRKAVSLYESLGVTPSSDASLRREASVAYLRLSDVLSVSGDSAGALASARTGLDFVRDLSNDLSAAPQALRDLVVGYSRVGDLLSETGQTQEALEYRRQALALMEQLAAREPNDPNNLRQLGVAYQKMGNSLGNPNYPNIGDYAGALDQLEKSVEVFRRASAAYPNNALFRRNYAVANSNAADILGALGRPDAALAREQVALETFQAQAREDPTNAAAKNDLAIGWYKMGEMLDARGRTREALVEYEKAVAIHQTLSAADPGNDRARLELASDLAAVGTVQAKLGMRERSLANHSQAVEMARALSAGNADNVELRVSVALALIGRADASALLAGRGDSSAFANASADRRSLGGGWSGSPAKSAESTRAADLASAEHDYVEAIGILEKLQAERAIEGTDVETLQATRKKLEELRQQR